VNQFLQSIVSGSTVVAGYAFLGISITLIYGMTRLLDFAQAAYMTAGAVLGYVLVDAGVPYLAAVPIVAVATAAAAWFVHLVLLQRISDDTALVVFLVTFGLALIVQTAIAKFVSVDARLIDTPFGGTFEIGGVRILVQQVVLVAVAVPVAVALYLAFKATQWGRAMRTVAVNADVATLAGIDAARARRSVYALASSISGLAGVLLGAIFAFGPFSGTDFLLKGFVVALAGGLGSVGGAMTMALVLGYAETFLVTYSPDLGAITLGPNLRDVYAYAILIACLAIRPQGIFRGTALDA
jgi:branched-subunit amino acid ABC-type transport system permease component